VPSDNVFRRAKEIKDENGWCPYGAVQYEGDGTRDTCGHVCLMVAVAFAEGKRDWRMWMSVSTRRVMMMREVIMEQWPERWPVHRLGSVHAFNDSNSTTEDMIDLVLEKCAVKEDELL
jgi:hypothetical protein